MMVGVAIGCLLLATLATLYVFSMKSFASMANYSDLNQKSRYASDLISRDIRSCNSVVSATPNQLVLNEPDDVTGNTTYIYDPNADTLSRTKNGVAYCLSSVNLNPSESYLHLLMSTCPSHQIAVLL